MNQIVFLNELNSDNQPIDLTTLFLLLFFMIISSTFSRHKNAKVIEKNLPLELSRTNPNCSTTLRIHLLNKCKHVSKNTIIYKLQPFITKNLKYNKSCFNKQKYFV